MHGSSELLHVVHTIGSHMRYIVGIVVFSGGPVSLLSVRARKPARDFSDYSHSVGIGIQLPLWFGRHRHMGIPLFF